MSVIKHLMQSFCASSGQRINFQKSRIFFPPAVPRQTGQDLSLDSGIPIASHLGNYLGVHLLHNRVSKGTYNHIIDRVQHRLAGWKARQLSLSGRATLIQSVSSSIPAYAMQSTHLPSSVCSTIDNYHHRFLWDVDQT